jgi:hypothetical protein
MDRCKAPDLVTKGCCLLLREPQAVCNAANCRSPLLLQWTLIGALEGFGSAESRLRCEVRYVLMVARQGLKEQLVEVIAQPRGLRERRFTLGRKQIEHCRLVVWWNLG